MVEGNSLQIPLGVFELFYDDLFDCISETNFIDDPKGAVLPSSDS
jgi:hypothetical protein